MKKLIGISIFSVSFLFVSCEKEQVKVTDTRTSEAPEWKQTKATVISPTNLTSGGTTTVSGTGSGSGITDPNNDPDMNSKKVVKQ